MKAQRRFYCAQEYISTWSVIVTIDHEGTVQSERLLEGLTFAEAMAARDAFEADEKATRKSPKDG